MAAGRPEMTRFRCHKVWHHFPHQADPFPKTFFVRPFSGYFDKPWIFDLASPMTTPWDLGSNHVAHLVDGSTRLQHGHSGFLRKARRAFETRTSTLVLRAFENPNSVGTSCKSPRPPQVAIPAPGGGGTSKMIQLYGRVPCNVKVHLSEGRNTSAVF